MSIESIETNDCRRCDSMVKAWQEMSDNYRPVVVDRYLLFLCRGCFHVTLKDIQGDPEQANYSIPARCTSCLEYGV